MSEKSTVTVMAIQEILTQQPVNVNCYYCYDIVKLLHIM